MHAPRSLALLFVLPFALLCTTLLFLLSTQPAYAFSPIFVKPNGSGAGSSSFANATTLQHALSIAHPGDQIWVATGIYTPGPTVHDTFMLPHGVALYGGFALNATQLSQRDWVANPSVLSGDIDGNDHTDAHGVITTTANIHGTNSLHVLIVNGASSPITDTTRIDGITVTAGDATPSANGGGIYCDGENGTTCNPHIENVTFAGNRALFGGAIFNDGDYSGDSSPKLVNVTFSGNSAGAAGGAMVNEGYFGASSPSLTNVTFAGNSAQSGGAIYNYGDYGASSPTLVNVTFSRNPAENGGAIYNDGDKGASSPSLFNVAFISNTASVNGGGMYNNGGTGASSPTLVNVTFAGNSAKQGGAMENDGYSGGASSPSLTNVTFAGNTASGFGGAMYNYGDTGASSPALVNVILWENTAPMGAQLYNVNATLFFTTSLVQDGISGAGIHNVTSIVTDGGGNLDEDPLFVDANNDNLRLKAGSPAVDSGTNSAITQTTDLDGNPRKIDGDGNSTVIVDMGAYEFQNYQLLTVTFSGSGSGKVTRVPAGALCGAPCSARYAKGSSVTLTATAPTTSTFSGWNGDCTGTTPCHLTMDAAKQVTTIFALKSYPLIIHSAGNGSGSVSNQPNQPSYLFGTIVILTASANPGSTFTGWSGACTGPGNPPGLCHLTIGTTNNVTATFVRNDAPSFTSTPGLVSIIGRAYRYAVTTSDPNAGDTLTLSAPTKPTWLTLKATGNGTATLTGTPGSGDVGANRVQLRVQDQVGAVATQSFTITVADPNTTGGVQGKVQDEQNKGLAGARLTLSNASRQAVAAALLTQTTSGSGNYLFEGVPAGSYTLTASMAGHDSSAPQAVTVQAGKTTIVAAIILQTSKPLLHLPLLDRAP